MKKLLFFSGILLAGVFVPNVMQDALAQGTSSGFCDIHSMSDTCKRVIKPFLYSNQNALHVALKSEAQVREIAFPTFEGEKYRVIINTMSMPKGTEVNVYDQDAGHKKRKQLFTAQSNGVSNFDTECKSGRLFIEYTIPAATATVTTGCAVVVVGFESRSAGEKDKDSDKAKDDKGKAKKK